MIDTHCHLLPGVDDGPESVQEALEMVAIAAGDDITEIIVTPHQRHPTWPNEDRPSLEALFRAFRDRAGDAPRLHLGAEVHADSELLGDLERGGLSDTLTLAGSRYLLLEFDVFPAGPDPSDMIREVLLTGRVPILSHPERIPWLAEDPALLIGLIEQGALTQVTAGSLTGTWGRYPQACCHFLLDHGLLHFVASDAHDAVDRTPVLSTARSIVAARWGEEVADAVTQRNPAAILADRPL